MFRRIKQSLAQRILITAVFLSLLSLLGIDSAALSWIPMTCSRLSAQEEGYQNVVPLVEPRVVKITGSGGFSGLEAYQSGILISDDGFVLTIWSYVLDTESPIVTTSDGQRFEAQLVGYDPRIEIAVLKIEANGLSCFNVDAAATAEPGASVLAFSNLFGVATGNEPVSVLHGRVAARTALNARRGARESTYQGDVYILDAITNNPGAAGGAVTNRRGELIGMIGKELRDSQSGVWLNFCIPIDSLAGSVHDIRSGKLIVAADNRAAPAEPMTPTLLGIVMVPDVIARTPPYIDRLIPDTVALAAGLAADDLIVEIDGHLTPSCKDVVREVGMFDRDSKIILTIQRGNRFISVEMELRK